MCKNPAIVGDYAYAPGFKGHSNNWRTKKGPQNDRVVGVAQKGSWGWTRRHCVLILLRAMRSLCNLLSLWNDTIRCAFYTDEAGHNVEKGLELPQFVCRESREEAISMVRVR